MKLAFTAAAVVASLVVAAPARGGDLAPPSACPPSPTLLLCLHNFTRHRHGLAPLRRSPSLAVAAQQKAAAIEHTGVFDHAPVKGIAWDAWFPYDVAGEAENIAEGYQTVRGVYQAWLQSREHRTNILQPWTRAFGSARIGLIWVVDFTG